MIYFFFYILGLCITLTCALAYWGKPLLVFPDEEKLPHMWTISKCILYVIFWPVTTLASGIFVTFRMFIRLGLQWYNIRHGKTKETTESELGH